MVRAGLASRGLGRAPVPGAARVPAASVVIATLLALLPIVSLTGWWPNVGLLMLVAWRLHRADPWPAWWAAPMGFVNDVVTGNPIGLSVALWPAMMLLMDAVDRRTQWRDYWIEWALAAVLIALVKLAEWRVASIGGAPVPLATLLPSIGIAIFCFPIAALAVARLDRWRLGR